MLFLASSSPRRRALLHEAGIPFRLCRPGPEIVGAGSPAELAVARAVSKARGAEAEDGHPFDERALVLGVDTVVDRDGVELGKPRDRDDAARMLRLLCGRQHRVHTGHCAIRDGVETTRVASSVVECAPIDDATIEAFLATEDWRGKAGGYGIQDASTPFLQLRGGDLDTVIGLSIRVVRSMLETTEGGVCPPN